jgi:hypothetical protein
VLAGKTDDNGQSASDRLQEERTADSASDEALRERYVDEADT